MDQVVTLSTALGDLALGARARIVGIDGGRQLTRRLLALGVRLGSEVRIEHYRGRGRVLAVGQTRIALGGGVVDKLRVEVLEPPVADALAARTAVRPPDGGDPPRAGAES